MSKKKKTKKTKPCNVCCTCSTCAARTTKHLASMETYSNVVKELERRLGRAKTIAQLLGILCALFTIVFYAKYGW